MGGSGVVLDRLRKGVCFNPSTKFVLARSKQVLHRLVDLRIFKAIEVDLRCREVGVSQRFGDNRDVDPGAL